MTPNTPALATERPSDRESSGSMTERRPRRTSVLVTMPASLGGEPDQDERELRGPLDDDFERLYADHFAVVWSVLGAMGIHGAQREDVAQEVWTLVYRKRARLRPDASPRAWVAALARGVVLRHRRTRARRDRKHRAVAIAGPRQVAPPSDRVDAGRTVDSLLADMNPEQRLAYVLVHGHGLSAPEVASVTGAPLNTIYSRLRLAKRWVARVADSAVDEERALQRRLAAADENGGSRDRVWTGLAGSLSLTGASASGLGSGAKVLAAMLLLGVPALGAARVMTDALVGPPTPERVTVRPPPQPEAVAPTATRHAAFDARAQVVPTSADASARGRGFLPAKKVTHKRSRRGARTKAVESARTKREDAPAQTVPTLGAEVDLLNRARAELRRGAPNAALALVDEHASKYGDGALADVREATRIEAICAAGDATSARESARDFASTRADSPAVEAVRRTCPTR